MLVKQSKQRRVLTMNEKLKALLCEAKFNRDERMRKKINLLVEADRQGNVRLACSRLGVSHNFYYYWHRKLESGGWTLVCLQEMSRRPKRSPRLSPQDRVERVLKARSKYPSYGPLRIRAILMKEHGLSLCPSTIAKILKRAKRVKSPVKVHRKAHLKRYELAHPGDSIQMDIKYIPYRIGPNQYYLFNAVDECTRWRFALVYENKGVWETEDFVKKLLEACPFKIKKIQTDNGTEFTNKFVSEARCFKKEPREHILDRICREKKIIHKLIPVGECELNGKVERSHWTDESEFLNRRRPFKTLSLLRKAYRRWIHFYNHRRLHSSLFYMTPMEMIQYKMLGVRPHWMELSKNVLIAA
jgi:transposase InsO family protein